MNAAMIRPIRGWNAKKGGGGSTLTKVVCLALHFRLSGPRVIPHQTKP